MDIIRNECFKWEVSNIYDRSAELSTVFYIKDYLFDLKTINHKFTINDFKKNFRLIVKE